MARVLEGKSIGLDQKNSAKRKPPHLENQELGYGSRYNPAQGFNSLQNSPNWFLGNWTLDPRLKWALMQIMDFYIILQHTSFKF
jgi:hypothetical protein